MKIKNFINDCINGDALLSEIDDYIDLWHESNNELPLYSFLGMTEKEYALYILNEENLGLIVAAHKDNIDITALYNNVNRSVARSDNSSKSQAIEDWLKKENLWE